MNVSALRHPVIVAAAGFALGLLADLLFYGQPAGISLPIIIGLTVIAMFALSRTENSRLAVRNLWLVPPLLFLAVMSAVRAEPTLRALNIGGTLLLLLLLANSLGARPLAPRSLAEYLEALFESSLFTGLMAVPLLGRLLKNARQGDRRVLWRVLLGSALALPFLCLFTVLFSSADLIFGGYIRDLIEAFSIPDLIGHTFLTLLLAWLFSGLLAYTLTRRVGTPGLFSAVRPRPAGSGSELPANEAPQQPILPIRGRLGMLETGIVLFSINALFAAFVGIQFAALFGGEAFLRRHNLTYSEYARRGFFELLAVAIITLTLILALEFLAGRQTRRQQTVFLAGSGLMLAMTVVILASAWQRMQLYELAYGFTRLRLYPQVFMVWLAVLIVYFLVFLVLGRARLFATGALLAFVGFTVTLNLMNPDVFIFRQNVARYENGATLDASYLGSLSEDAVPQMIGLLASPDPAIRDEIGPWLAYRLQRLDARQSAAGWPSYHMAISRAYRVLERNRELIETFEPADRWLMGARY